MCIICECDDMPIFFRESFHVARKPHICVECKKEIQIGANYLYMVGKWDRWDENIKVETFHMCLYYAEDWKNLVKIVSEKENEKACELIGQLRYSIEDAFYCECLGARHPLVQKWCPEIFEKYKDDDLNDYDNSRSSYRAAPGQKLLSFLDNDDKYIPYPSAHGQILDGNDDDIIDRT